MLQRLAHSSILATPNTLKTGTITEYALLESFYAWSPIVFTVDGIDVPREQQSSRESYTVFSSETLMEDRFTQSAKGFPSIIVTEEGIVTLLRFLQFQNAADSILFTVGGKTRSVMPQLVKRCT